MLARPHLLQFTAKQTSIQPSIHPSIHPTNTLHDSLPPLHLHLSTSSNNPKPRVKIRGSEQRPWDGWDGQSMNRHRWMGCSSKWQAGRWHKTIFSDAIIEYIQYMVHLPNYPTTHLPIQPSMEQNRSMSNQTSHSTPSSTSTALLPQLQYGIRISTEIYLKTHDIHLFYLFTAVRFCFWSFAYLSLLALLAYLLGCWLVYSSSRPLTDSSIHSFILSLTHSSLIHSSMSIYSTSRNRFILKKKQFKISIPLFLTYTCDLWLTVYRCNMDE